jgi:hypothetical protein
MSAGSRDKFFVGHLLKWYYQEMVSRFLGKVNQSKAVPTIPSRRGGNRVRFEICDLNRPYSIFEMVHKI